MTAEQREAKRVYQAAWYQDHREEARAYRADHSEEAAAYRAAHRDEARAYQAAYRAAHKDERAAYDAAYYADHREEAAAYYAEYRKAHSDAILGKQATEFAEFTEWLQILRTNNGCGDCETHEGRLVHHHVDPSTKLYNVSGMCGHSLDALEDELEKCVVLCHPCHMARHVEMRAA